MKVECYKIDAIKVIGEWRQKYTKEEVNGKVKLDDKSQGESIGFILLRIGCPTLRQC